MFGFSVSPAFLHDDFVTVPAPSLIPGSGRPRSPAFNRYYGQTRTPGLASPDSTLSGECRHLSGFLEGTVSRARPEVGYAFLEVGADVLLVKVGIAVATGTPTVQKKCLVKLDPPRRPVHVDMVAAGWCA